MKFLKKFRLMRNFEFKIHTILTKYILTIFMKLLLYFKNIILV